jgi:hypothetical protein
MELIVEPTDEIDEEVVKIPLDAVDLEGVRLFETLVVGGFLVDEVVGVATLPGGLSKR